MTLVVKPETQVTTTGPLASFLFALSLLALLLIGGCSSDREPARYSGSIMGTTYHVTVADHNPPANLAEKILKQLEKVDGAMSTYKPDSELNRFNNSPPGSPVELTPELMQVLTQSKTVFQASGGTFDPTVGPLVDLWGFGPDFHQDRVPEKVEIERLLGVIGFDGITLQDTRATRIRDVRVDLSAIAKGFAVDQVAELLQGYDLVNFMVEVGGEIRVSGHNSANTPWQLAIEKPSVAERAIQRIVGVTDLAIATSGSYRNFFELNGVRYSHTIDPRTGYPVTHNMVSVTVLADTCAQADALATAFTVMGPERTLELADQLNIAVFLLVEDITGIKEFYSTGFQPYMKDQ